MPLAKRREQYVSFPAAQPLAPLTADLDGLAAAPSPARALQQQLAQRTGEAAAAELGQWSPRRALAFIVASSAALWMAILIAGAEVVRAVA